MNGKPSSEQPSMNWDLLFGSEDRSTATPQPASTPAPNLENLYPEMFNACQRGDLAAMQALYAQGVPLTITHPYNQATLIHVAIVPGISNPASYGWESVCHPKIIEWLLTEMSKSPQYLTQIFAVQYAVTSTGKKSDFPAYNEKTMCDGYGGYTIKTLADYLYSYLAGPKVLGEARSQTCSRNYASNLSYAQKTANMYSEAKNIIDKFYAQMQALQTSAPTPAPTPY